jgi:hypothetical protein
VATKRTRVNQTQISGAADVPSVETIEAAANAAKKLAELAEEWAESLLSVYRKAPHLAGAQALIDKINRAELAMRPR